MITFARRSLLRSENSHAFSLIELLTVMAIILVLAGLILSIAGSAQNNAAKSRATAEIKQFDTALENYKSDNGAYPTDSNSSEVLNARSQQDWYPTNNGGNSSHYVLSSQFLYRALSGFLDGTNTVKTTNLSKAYITFQANQLAIPGGGTGTPSPTSPDMCIVDPYGNSYGYSTIQAAKAANAPNDPSVPTTYGYNPTYDLWSTAGYGNGKSYPANLKGATQAEQYQSVWIKNW